MKIMKRVKSKGKKQMLKLITDVAILVKENNNG